MSGNNGTVQRLSSTAPIVELTDWIHDNVDTMDYGELTVTVTVHAKKIVKVRHGREDQIIVGGNGG